MSVGAVFGPLSLEAFDVSSGFGLGAGESLVHGYLKRQATVLLREAGLRAEIEAEFAGGWDDVLAGRDQRTLVVEIETGRSDAVGNVRRALRGGTDRVAVVASTARALRTVERQLGAAGLLIPGRVEVFGGLGALGELLASLTERDNRAA